jgi:hypothetical protein
MIRWYMRIDREVVEQRALFDLPWSHHRLSSCLNKTESMSLRSSTSDFFNRIGPEPTCEALINFCFLGYNRHSNFRASLPFLDPSHT